MREVNFEGKRCYGIQALLSPLETSFFFFPIQYINKTLSKDLGATPCTRELTWKP